jgi:hypothetical protein
VTTDQPELFEDIRSGFVPDPLHVRNRLTDMLGTMQVSEAWPWRPAVVAFYRETVWPYLCDLLPDEEAERWRSVINSEIERLDIGT